jgi:hypothetical protein
LGAWWIKGKNMEGLPFLLTYFVLFIIAVGVVVGFLASLPIALVGIAILVYQKYLIKATSPDRFRIPFILVLIGVYSFLVLGYQILHFLIEVFR